jgi:hypothetical protein
VLIAILVITIAGAVNAWRREHRAGIERSFFEQADQREAGE